MEHYCCQCYKAQETMLILLEAERMTSALDREEHDFMLHSMTIDNLSLFGLLDVWIAWPNRVCVCVFLCAYTSALGVTGIENSIEQILLTDETDLCHILLPVFGSQWRSWARTARTKRSTLSLVAKRAHDAFSLRHSNNCDGFTASHISHRTASQNQLF